MENDFEVTINQADPSFLELKCNGVRVRKTSDTLYHLYPTSVFGEEIKLKLYYKNLPVDVITLPVTDSPIVEVSLENQIEDPISIDVLSNLKLNVQFIDKYLKDKDWKLFSFNTEVKRGDFPPSPFIVIRNNSLSSVKQFRSRLQSGDKIVINDIVFVNNRNQRVSCQSNYFEIELE
jgi:hypothetical protein